MKPPSTKWSEQIAADEGARFALYAQQMQAVQNERSKKFGNGRALHRKQILALRAEWEVLPNVPDHARQGLFKAPGVYEAMVRLSNGGSEIKADRVPDIRGFAIKVLGVSGVGALGTPAKSQDFLLINREVFGLKNSAEFIGLVLAVSKGGGALIAHFVKTYGFFQAFGQLKKTLAGLNKPFSGFATERFFSSAPLACGPYAIRVRMLPASQNPTPGAERDYGEDMKQRLGQGALSFDIQLQFFVDETITPIEDASVNWEESNAPYVTVARLRIPKQEFTSDAYRVFATKVEKEAFDPWSALMEHRPLGDVMRARKDTYFASQTNRKS